MDSQAEPSRRSPNAIVKAQHLESSDDRACGQGGREVNRIERSDRFAGKWLAGALNDVRTDPEDVPMSRRHSEMRASIRGFGLAQFAKRGGPEQHTIAFDQRQIGRDNPVRGRQQPAHVRP